MPASIAHRPYDCDSCNAWGAMRSHAASGSSDTWVKPVGSARYPPGSACPASMRALRYTSQASGFDGWKPSAMRAARRAAAGPEPPNSTVGPVRPLRRSGAGVTFTERSPTCTGAPSRAARTASTASVVRATRSPIGTPNMSNSEGTYPLASTRVSRPALIESTTTASSASRTGSWNGAATADTQIATCEVRAATAAAIVRALGR